MKNVEKIDHNTQLLCVTYLESKFMNIEWTGWHNEFISKNSYDGIQVYDNRVYLLYTGASDTFGSTSNDFVLTIIDLRTGSEISRKIFGSTTDDSAIDIVVNHFGVYVLANIGDGFKDSSATDSFTTQNSNTNFAVMLLDYDGNIHEIESYDSADAANSLGAEYPKKLIVGRQNKHDPLYAFISTRDDGTTNQGGGVYITQPASQQSLFVTGTNLAAWGGSLPNWELCHSSVCFKCSDGYKVQKGECKLACDDYFYHQHDDADNTKDIDICVPCHETCKTCSDSSEYGCLTCDTGTGKVHDSTAGTCKCDTSLANKYLGLYGTCVSSCGDELAAIKQYKWMRTCPEDSDDYSAIIDITTARSKSASTDWYDLSRHLYVTEGVTLSSHLYNLPISNLGSFSQTFWIRIESTSATNFPIFSSSKQ